MLLTGLCTLGLASLALAVHTPVKRVAHETRRSPPAGWTPVRRAEPDRVLPLRVGLAQANVENLEAFLLDVAHPESPNYSRHWTPARVAETFRPARESVDAVRAWLVADGGIEPGRITLSRSGAWVAANVTVGEAEALLGTEYYVYEHDDGGEHVACHQGYHLPEDVSRHVDLITPTLHFDIKMKRHGSVEPVQTLGSAKNVGKLPGPTMGGELHNIFNDLEHCDEAITLPCLRALYDFVYTPVATNKNTIGVVEYTPQSHNATDFDVFFRNFSKSQIGERPTLVSIDGGFLDPTGDIGESSLDLQYVLGLIGTKRQDVLLYQVGDAVEGASFNNLLDGLDASYCTFEGGDDPEQDGIYPDNQSGGFGGPESCGTAKRAFVITTSYGTQEADLTPAYIRRQCTEYGKLSLTGITFIYSSGDAGVGGRRNVCLDEGGNQVVGGNIFSPTFPGGCPFVTSVGATQVSPGHKVTDPESAVFQRFPSGGGFSNIFSRPSFQNNAVSTYLKRFPPGYAPNIFNSTGRGYPDVSANGLNFSVALNGVFGLVSGTSASAPTFAAILSAVNDARLAVGKRPVGWINPAIYSDVFHGAFNDITNGSNPNCGTNGFQAKPGWDPVSGLGTPNFPKLLDRWLLLP